LGYQGEHGQLEHQYLHCVLLEHFHQELGVSLPSEVLQEQQKQQYLVLH
jgi:hypothetical protein